MYNLSNKQYISVVIVISLLSFLLTWFALFNLLPVTTVLTLSLLMTLIGGGLASIFTVILKIFSNFISILNKNKNELQATAILGKKTKIPLNLGGHAATAQLLSHLEREIYIRKPKIILECGSGTSTLVSASCLKDIGKGKIISLDHNQFYAEKTNHLLSEEGLQEFAEVIFAPLKEYKIDNKKWQWYGADFNNVIATESSIDMLIVDGPNAALQKLSRYPAVPVLKKYLVDDVYVILDDGFREDERNIANKWSSDLSLEKHLNKGVRGFWILGG